MKKIAILTLITSSLIAEIPGAGRPNPGAFFDNNTEVLKNIEIDLKEIKSEIQQLIKIQREIEIPEFDDENFEKIRLEIKSLNTRFEYLIWLVDHPLEEDEL